MTNEKFFRNKTALVTIITACQVVLISQSIRQTIRLLIMNYKKLFEY